MPDDAPFMLTFQLEPKQGPVPLIVVAGLRTKQVQVDWWHASGYDPTAPDAHNTGYWVCGETKAQAIENLQRCLQGHAEKRNRL